MAEQVSAPGSPKFFDGHVQVPQTGLWIPSDLATMRAAVDDVAKGASPAVVEALNKKMGALYSLWYHIYASTYQYGAAEKPTNTPAFKLLREVFAKSIIDQLIVKARVDQIRHVSQPIIVEGRQKGWKVRHKRHADPNFRPDKRTEERCLEMEQLLQHPNKEAHPGGFQDYLIKAVKGELIIDRKALVKWRDGAGRVINWYLLPPDEVKPRLEVLLRHLAEGQYSNIDQAYRDIYAKYQVDISNAAYVQEVDGRILGAWDTDHMSVDITNPSDEINRAGFGVSCLELSLEATTLMLLGLHYNKQLFLANYPEAFLILKGEFNPEGLQAFKSQIYAQIGPQGNARLPIIPTGGAEYEAELLRLRDTLTEMQFIQLLRFAIALKCAAYRMDPRVINFSPDMGEKQAIIAGENNEELLIAMSQEEGFHSILMNQSRWLGEEIIETWYDDLTLWWSVEDQPNPQQAEDLWTKRLANGATVDEYRNYMGWGPLAEQTGGMVSGGYSNSPFFFQQIQMAMMLQQAQAQQQQEQQRAKQSNFTSGANVRNINDAREKRKSSLGGASPRERKAT